MGAIEFLKKVDIQAIKDLGFSPTDVQLVDIALSIMIAAVKYADVKGETLSDLSDFTSILDGASYGPVVVSWNSDNSEHDEFTLTLNDVTVTQDVDEIPQLIVNTEDGINDAEAVELDQIALAIGLGTNVDLDNVESNLTFPSSGSSGTTISWNATAHSQVTDVGVVSQGGGNITADVVATITKNAASDTKTFSVTVLQGGLG